MNKYGTLTEFPLGIVRKARKLNIKDTRGTRNFGSLKIPTSSVAKKGGNMNLNVQLSNIEIMSLEEFPKYDDIHVWEEKTGQGEQLLHRGFYDAIRKINFAIKQTPLILTKEMEVKWIRFF